MPRPIALLARRLAGPSLFVAGVVGAWAWVKWPDVREVAEADPTSVAAITRAEDATGTHIMLDWTGLRDISPHLSLAVLVAEDIEFFQHRGFSWAEMRFAMEDARAGGRVRGASTITQQLAKNLWLSPDRSVVRKICEAGLAFDLERFVGKRRILELYLDVVQFGPGVFGAQAAALHYFHKPALFLTEDESAMLAAGLTRPSLWNPDTTTPEYEERVALIRRRMGNAEFLWRHLLQL